MELELLIRTGTVVLCCVSVLWVVSIALKDTSIADIWWGPGFAIIAWTARSGDSLDSLRLDVTTALLTLWGVRLGLYLARRNLGHGEDKRYVAIRGGSPHFWWTSLFKVFYLQGILQVIVALPVFGIANSSTPMTAMDWLGASIALSGIVIEATADHQLTAFKNQSTNARSVMRSGLWGWTRHPNYFGNALIWLGIGLIGIASGAPLWTAAGPAIMWFLLLQVSGVSMLERTIVERRPEYRQYIKEVPAFIPRPPRNRNPIREE